MLCVILGSFLLFALRWTKHLARRCGTEVLKTESEISGKIFDAKQEKKFLHDRVYRGHLLNNSDLQFVLIKLLTQC